MADEEFAMPLAPSRGGVAASRPAGPVPATPMSNKDFRQLLMTPRAGVSTTPKPTPVAKTPARTPGGGSTAGGAQKSKPKQRPKPKKDAEEDEEGKTTYVDRAKLRREQEQSGEAPPENPLGVAIPPPGQQYETLEEQRRAIEESKYLGGDMEHTHNVKGLDKVLADKTRAEILKKQQEDEEEREASRKAAEDAKLLKFKSSVAQGIHSFVTADERRRNAAAAERFSIGRVAFVFQLEEEEGGFVQDLPMTVVRAKADVMDLTDIVHASIDGPLLDRLGKLMSYLRLGNPKLIKKLRRKEREAQQAALEGAADASGLGGHNGPPVLRKPVDADEDIFGDAGKDYMPAAPKAKPRPGDKQSYFGDANSKGEAARAPLRSSKADNPEQPPPPPGEPPPHYYAQHGQFVPPPPPPGPGMPPIPPPPPAGPDMPPIPQAYAYGMQPAYPTMPHAMYPDPNAAHVGWTYDAYGNPVWDQSAYAAYQAYPQQHPGTYQQAYPPQPPEPHLASLPLQHNHHQQQQQQQQGQGQGQGQGRAPDTASALLASSTGMKPNIFSRGAGSRVQEEKTEERLKRIRAEIDQEEKGKPAGTTGKKGDLESYAECYAGYETFATEVVSDDEDLGQMDAGKGGTKGLSRKDFETDDEYFAYKAQQEAAPKSAFQFGVKGTDGRRTGKERDKKQSKELQQIRRMMTDQHGDKYEAAFKKPTADDGGSVREDSGKTPRPGADTDGMKRSKRIRL